MKALKDDPHLRAGLNVHDGKLTCEPVAAAHGLAYTPAESVLGPDPRVASRLTRSGPMQPDARVRQK
jgi:hypothetical protein